MTSEQGCLSKRFVVLAQPANAPIVRAVLRATLNGCCPRIDDLLVVTGEFVADAIRGPGSHVGVTVDPAPGQVRIEVEAEVGSRDSEEYLFGLALVEGHADRWGRQRVDGRGIWWAEFYWKD